MIALEAVNLTKLYKHSRQPALDELNLKIDGNQIFTLLGRNGAGKTTFLRIASTQLMPTSGSVTVLGLDVVKDAGQIRQRIAVTPQDAETIYPLTARDHIMLSLRMRGMEKTAAVQKTRSAIEALELVEVADMNTDWLSGGLKQRVIVAMAIATGASLMTLVITMGVVALLWTTTTSIGFFFSAYAPSTQNAFIINGFIATLLSVLPPVYYSVSKLPPVVVPLAEILPTTEASSLFQGALGLGYSITPVFSFVVLFVAAAFLLLLVSFKMKWRET